MPDPSLMGCGVASPGGGFEHRAAGQRRRARRARPGGAVAARRGPYAPLRPLSTVVPLTERLAAERADQTPLDMSPEDEGGQLAFDLAA
jgi:hypothetical protein